jgi:hypothetical protein
MKRCFIISPIGEEGSNIREHSDDVLDYIIRPAMEELGIEAIRSDHKNTPGKISDQMFGSILNDDLCVAVLTFNNPNVFYELAVAQSAAKPVIILLEKGHDLPFDLKDLRVIYYDLKPRPIHERMYVKAIIEQVNELFTNETAEKVPFAPSLSPLGGNKYIRFYSKAENFGPSDDWVNILNDSKEMFDLCGISVGAWIKPKNIREIFKAKSDEGCSIRILIADEKNLGLPFILNERDHQGSLVKTKQSISETYKFFFELQNTYKNLELRMMSNCLPHQMMVINENKAVVINYLFSSATFRSPLFEFKRQSDFYLIYKSEFDSLWENSVKTDINF